MNKHFICCRDKVWALLGKEVVEGIIWVLDEFQFRLVKGSGKRGPGICR